ncbi:putative spermidine/putrescine transport system ATP-binding protein [Halopseudomonas litoralis]|uniref:Spermidine/putrescine import ATP-binding protein PotA n=1 Tax=Halopseudomonas litoralis TaxID=797277 RepID=A0A1H1QGM2_9GAMM|nr:ABC transporter ATP-binding protein [Halopseudomonas litoralis]SDS22524.1 putative spermidine/putrescine transport system ATP-binding protein [Halopseudomonas litoralis]
MTSDYVSFRNVQKSYDGDTLVVKNFSLDISKGEFLTMLGPSGSGKTTCLMMLAGFETPTSGEIRLDGQMINKMAPHKRGIGMVFQNYALFPHMTIAENLAYPLTVRKMPKAEIEQRVNTSLDMVEMRDKKNRTPGQLSGGQKQRIALARALIFEPKLVLMDEPLGALDKNLREQMQYEIKRLHERLGITAVYVTHDQTEALTMSDRIAVFDDGIVQQVASPSVLYEEPATAFVANFIGENNAFAGRLGRLANGKRQIEMPNSFIQTEHDSAGQEGSPVVLSVRPERIMLAPGEDVENRFTARVKELIYHGDHIRACVRVFDQSDVVLKLINSPGLRVPTLGEQVTIGWRASDCRALV